MRIHCRVPYVFQCSHVYRRFWHLLIRKSFTSHSIFIVNNVFRVTPFTPLSRYLITFGAFFMSAGMHIFVAPDVALKCALWPQFRYYFTIAGAIILEDVVSTSLKSLTRNKASKDKPAVSKKKISSQEAKTSAVEKTTDKTGLNQRKSVTANSSAMNGSANKTQKVYEPSPRDDRAPLWLRIPGYVWVLAFEVWSTSKFLFLTQQCFATL